MHPLCHLEPCVMCRRCPLLDKSVASFTPPRTINGDLCAGGRELLHPNTQISWRDDGGMFHACPRFSNKNADYGLSAPVPYAERRVGSEVSDTRIPGYRLPRCRSKFSNKFHACLYQPWLCRQWLCGSCQSRHPLTRLLVVRMETSAMP